MRVKRFVRELRPGTRVTIAAISKFSDEQPKHITCKDAQFIESTEEVKDLQIMDIIIRGANAITIFASREDMIWN